MSQQQDDFARQAAEAPPGLIAEFVDFLRNNKKWWLTPIIVVLLMVGALLIASGTALSPFIYVIW
ncbi:MAG: DUF5989 family protein [Planctomycetales bacterium]